MDQVMLHGESPSVDAGLIPQASQYDEIHRHFQETHSLEAERRRSEMLRFYSGWALAGVFGIFALVQGVRDINRPAPRDRFEIAILHEDGSYSAPTEMQDMTRVQQREVLETSLMNYITYRAGYTYAAGQHNYNIVSAMTATNEQVRYQRIMLSSSDPLNPLVKYGQTAQLVPLNIRLDPDPTGPNTWNFTYTLHLTVAETAAQDIPMRGSLTYVRGPVLSKVRVPYDPASVVILQYEDHPVDGAAR